FDGGAHSFTYDSNGRLTKDTNANNTAQTLTCSQDGGSPCDMDGTEVTVTVTDATGAATTYGVKSNADGSTTRTVTEPSGAKTVVTGSADGSTITTQLPGGSTETRQYVPDLRFGWAAPVLASDVLTRPSGKTYTRTETQDVTLLNPADPYLAK